MSVLRTISDRSTLVGVLASAALACATSPSLAAQQGEDETTRLVVRAVASDAKVIGSGVGGARVTVVDVESGDVLAQGVQRGGTGDTDAIMRAARERGATVYGGEGTAAFTADLTIDRPTRVRVTAEGPLDAPKTARQSASTTLWMIPGRDVDGQGLVITLHGFLVEVLEAVPSGEGTTEGDLAIRARIRMMCGCPTRPGGLWDSDRYTITARLVRNGEVVAEAPMRFTGETSVFGANLSAPDGPAGAVEVVVTDTERVNTGFARMPLDRP